MRLDRYLQALGERWFVVALFILVGMAGTFGYFQWSGGGTWGDFTPAGASSATATVAVLEPAVTDSMTGQQALVNFASVVESRALSERVVRKLRLDISPDELRSRTSVKLSRTLVPSVPTPLYIVSVQDKDGARALDLTKAVVDEARLLFMELNTLDPGEIDAALASIEGPNRKEVAEATAALREFEATNGVWMLSTQIDGQLALVNSLRQATYAAQADSVSGGKLEEKLRAVESDLVRLRGLQPEYDRLNLEVTLASAALSHLTSRETEIALLANPAAADAVREKSAAARERLDGVRDAFAAFQRANNAWDLPSELAAETARLAELRRTSSEASAAKSDEDATIKEVESALASAEAELSRLRSLQPEYDRRAFDVALAASAVVQYESQEQDLIATEEDGKLYAVRSELGSARRTWQSTRDALATFFQRVGVSDFATALATQADRVAELRRTRDAFRFAHSDAARADLQSAVERAEKNIARLRGLQPEYDRLAQEVSDAAATVSKLAGRELELDLGGGSDAAVALVREKVWEVRARLDRARAGLAAFHRANGLSNLPSDLESQTALVSDLRRMAISSRVPLEARERAVASEELELKRLLSLVPQHEQLTSRLARATAQLQQMQAQKVQYLIQGSLSPSAQVKMLDTPNLSLNLLWAIVLYLLGAVLGTFAGLVMVYLMAYFDSSPQTADDVEQLMGAPVLARVPRAL